MGVVGNEDGEVGRAWTMEGLICNITHVTEAFEKQPEKDTSFCKKGIIIDVNKRTSVV